MPTETTRTFHHTYGESSPYSIGIEEEFQLVDEETFALVPRVDAVLANASDEDRLHVKQVSRVKLVSLLRPVSV